MAKRTYSDEEIIAIRTLYKSGNIMEALAAELGTSRQTISKIVRRKTYCNIKDNLEDNTSNRGPTGRLISTT